MAEPTIRIGGYGNNADTVLSQAIGATFTSPGTGVIRSLQLGFVPDYFQCTDLATGKTYAAYPSRLNFSNGTATRITSTLAILGAAGNNHKTDTTPGSYIMAMGGPNDVSTSVKQKGVYIGRKLNRAANWSYIAMRSGSAGGGGVPG